jgi:hypothetical protein
VSTYVLNKFNPTHGGAYKQNHAHGISRIRFKVHFANTLTHAGVHFEKIFANHFYNPSDSVVFEKSPVELPDSPSAIAQAHSHTLYRKTTHAKKTSQTQTLVLRPHSDSSNTVYTAIQIGLTLCRGCTSLPTSRVPRHEHLSAGADPIKAITHLI